jgi:hypothetical protein
MPFCKAITEDGKLCVNEVLPNSYYCKSHQRPGKPSLRTRITRAMGIGVLGISIFVFILHNVLPPIADIAGLYSVATEDNKAKKL